MRTPILTLTALACLALSACKFGGWHPSVSGSGYGGPVELTLPGVQERIQAELLRVDETGLLVLQGARVVHVPWSDLFRVRVAGGPPGTVTLGGMPPNAQALEALRLRSRYPFGLTDAQLQELLAASGQDEVGSLR